MVDSVLVLWSICVDNSLWSGLRQLIDEKRSTIEFLIVDGELKDT